MAMTRKVDKSGGVRVDGVKYDVPYLPGSIVEVSISADGGWCFSQAPGAGSENAYEVTVKPARYERMARLSGKETAPVGAVGGGNMAMTRTSEFTRESKHSAWIDRVREGLAKVCKEQQALEKAAARRSRILHRKLLQTISRCEVSHDQANAIASYSLKLALLHDHKKQEGLLRHYRTQYSKTGF